MTSPQPAPAPRRPVADAPRPSHASSVVALVLGIGLAVGVSALFGLLGWGGELASQTAGAASGAAPLILDGVRQRRSRARRQDLLSLSRGRQTGPKLLVASLFGFTLLAVDSAVGFVVVRSTQAAIAAAGGDVDRWLLASFVPSAVVVLPIVVVATLLLGLAAGHRLGEHRKRWIAFGMGIYLVVRIIQLALTDPVAGFERPAWIAGAVVTTGLLTGVALLGAWWARRTQPVFNATSFFRRLPEEDQAAALALLGDSVDAAATRRTTPPT